MPGTTTAAQLRAAQRTILPIWKYTSSNSTAKYFRSLWKEYYNAPAGNPPTGAGEVPTRLTDGAPNVRFPDAPSGTEWYIEGYEYGQAQNGTSYFCQLLVCDRLWHNSGLTSNINTLQTINGGNITRYDGADSLDNIILLETNTAVANLGVAQTLTINYNDKDGGAKSTSDLAPSSSAWFQTGQASQVVPLADGNGIQNIVSCQWGTAPSGSAGNFGIVIAKPLLVVNWAGTNLGSTGLPRPHALQTGLPKLENGACLYLLGMNNYQANLPYAMISLDLVAL